ncbi:MAG: alpha amylase C-terminal domain-containing protein [Candidatus Gastranaerophilales bacterium]|nr:alpha amylase C-terminal domain-containing protein [Candidatus Gastranaerophilales bacterium]
MQKNNHIHNINVTTSPCVVNTWNKIFGAFFLDNGNSFFRLFTFSGVKNVMLEIKPYKKQLLKYNMNKIVNGIWQIELDAGIVSNGDRYRFLIDYMDEIIAVKDPCSMWQDSYFKWSKIYNHSLFQWTDAKWMCGENYKKVSRLSNDTNKLTPVEGLRIYELHIGTFTQEGTFLAAKEKIEKIANKLHFNAIEIMPVENTYSFNWGYDGVDKYAPNHTYGTPDDLKDLINYAHNCGLNVIMDIVPNHLGPDIALLHKTGPYTEGYNCFGYKFNYEKDENSEYVRDFIIGAALNWIINYHCDGLRVDMTKFMCSDYTMKQMAAEINFHTPDAFLIAEDGRDNDERVTRPFPAVEAEENELNHQQFIDKIRKNNVSLSSLGFDTEWDFPFHKQIAASVLGVWDCRMKNLCAFDYSLRFAQYRVKYPMSHDEIGNIDGTRLISKIMVNELNLYDKMCDCCHSLKCKLTAHAAHRILISLVTGKLEKMTDENRIAFYKDNSLTVDLPVSQIFKSYLKAVSMHKLVIGKIYSIPGPKMIFQGDEEANLSYFKFFRKFSTGPELYLIEKGYEPGLPAFLDSKLSSVIVCDKYSYINDSVRNYVTDLNLLCENNIAISSGHIEKTIVNEQSDIHAIYSKKIYNEIFSVSNFSSVSYLKNYGIMFPKGKWKEIFNSDNLKYAGEGKYLNSDLIFEQFSYISLSAYGIIFFEKIY